MTVRRMRTPTGDQAWQLGGHAEVRQWYTDRRLGLTHPAPESAARFGEHPLEGPSPLYSHDDEHAEHQAVRALLQPFFGGRRLRALREPVRALVAELLDELAGRTPPVDLHATLSAPLSARVLCALLGVPYADRDLLRKLVDRMDEPDAPGQADLTDYLTELAQRATGDGEDVLSGLRAAGLSTEDTAGMATMLLFAGYDSVAVTVDDGVRLLSRHRDQWELLRDRPELAPGAVEEVLRLGDSSGFGFPRYARQDVQIDGTAVRRGDAVLLDTTLANVDPAAFAEPERFDVTRTPNPHLSFGHGPWHCIGAPLARLELTEVFTALPARFPQLRLAVAEDELAMVGGTFTARVRELPVTW
nr:cytochrome P450 [Kibdelosporangium sp. MJ126-NF4]CEL13628.1 putative cytochrome P450 hydroxylase [Kibdelosporangium sp. MJ126-NF4]CTQ99314.1 putative cytochrome P450 hydroxylase [Kibdelosporangium sp. MJ126-NF4]